MESDSTSEMLVVAMALCVQHGLKWDRLFGAAIRFALTNRRRRKAFVKFVVGADREAGRAAQAVVEKAIAQFFAGKAAGAAVDEVKRPGVRADRPTGRRVRAKPVDQEAMRRFHAERAAEKAAVRATLNGEAGVQ